MAFQIMSIINLLMLSVIQVTLPRLSYLSEGDDETAYDKLLNTISQLYFITLFPAAIGIIIVSNLIVVIYGGTMLLLDLHWLFFCLHGYIRYPIHSWKSNYVH